MSKYTPIIGLEVHVELKTKSKMFCGCSAEYFGTEPNSHTCPVCLGLPGALPVPNKTAIDWCIKIALALNCEINEFSKFDRKNYFYPDLSKGYQISQYDLPFGHDGYMILNNKKKIRINRAHMEEDTGKLSHQNVDGDKVSLIDFNRSGVPLVEIVTEADFRDSLEVKEYLQKLQQIVRYIDVANADMDKGEMRLEPNISLKLTTELPEGILKSEDFPKYKVEVKNINSFRFVEKAITFEAKRQEEILEEGKLPAQETRGWDETKQKTFSQRSKEDAHDYRYFPEPDIPPIVMTKEQISTLRNQLPELPDEKLARFQKEFSLSFYNSEILTREIKMADYFEKAVTMDIDHHLTGTDIGNRIINTKVNIDEVSPAELIKTIAAAKQTVTVDESKLQTCIDEVLTEQEKAVEDYKSGKETVIMFLVGQVMRKLGQKVDALLVKEKLQERLK